MKCKVNITLEIEVDELQYEDDGFIGLENIKESFEDHYSDPDQEGGFDMKYTILSKSIEVVKKDLD